MGTALLLALVVVCAGYAVLRAFGLTGGRVAIGLLAPAGLAALAVVTTWYALAGIPPMLSGLAALALAAIGIVFVARDRGALTEAAKEAVRRGPWTLVILLAALAIPYVVMATAYWWVQVPLSPHDGAFHVEVVQALRDGERWANWYPPGLHATFAAMLGLMPWVDTARGAFELGLSLTLLAPLTAFGLAQATWRSPRISALAALMVSLTDLFPYFPQVWSGWPLAMAMLLVVGLWTVAIEYIAKPSWPRAALAGVLVGAIILVHGTELYTAGLVLLVLGLGSLRRLQWRRLLPDMLFGVVVALVLAAPYLPSLVRWAGAGGAAAVGVEEAQAMHVAAAESERFQTLFRTFALDALGIDLPLRVLLILIGAIWVIRNGPGRSLLATGVVFAAIAVLFTYFLWIEPIQLLFGVSFPWGYHYRLFMVVAIVGALIAALGWDRLASRIRDRARILERSIEPGTPLHRRVWRAAALMPLTWLVLATWAMAQFQTLPVADVSSFGEDDERAMAWLRQNARSGEVLANDWYADAGIWAPYKAGIPILMPRLGSAEPSAKLVLDNVDRLNEVPEARAAACDLRVAYVYHGAELPIGWDQRSFPPLERLRAAPRLEEVFSSGEAVVFRVRPAEGCGS